MTNIIFHIDVNSAFLSWTAIKLLKNGYNLDIRNEIAVIGGNEEDRNGIITAASIPAKKIGIRVPDPLFKVRKIYKNVLVFPGDYKLYSEMSNKLFLLLSKYSPDIEVASIDECYLDYGKVALLHGDYLEFAKKIQKEIYETLGFTVNIGIANNKLCAKMASDFEKPNKIHTLFSNEIEEKMWPLPIGDLFGIGKKTVPKLKEIGIYTIGDLAKYNELMLKKHFQNQSKKMIESAHGIDYSIVNSKAHEPLGIGHEITLKKDSTNILELEDILFEISDLLSIKLRKNKKYATCVCIILKDSFFQKKTHQKKLANGIDTGIEIYRIAKELLNEAYDSEPIRLIGIRLTNFEDNLIYQTSLFEDSTKKIENSKLDKLIDTINLKYGNKVIKKANLIKKM